MLLNGTARLSESAWSFVSKKDKGWRPCSDYRGLNAQWTALRPRSQSLRGFITATWIEPRGLPSGNATVHWPRTAPFQDPQKHSRGWSQRQCVWLEVTFFTHKKFSIWSITSFSVHSQLTFPTTKVISWFPIDPFPFLLHTFPERGTGRVNAMFIWIWCPFYCNLFTKENLVHTTLKA
jgi:hypothetical protein